MMQSSQPDAGTGRVLVLGGTAEASALVAALGGRSGPGAMLALAGATTRPRAATVAVRRGGFGGSDGLTRYLIEAQVPALVDATHPFAARMSRQAAAAAASADVPRVRLWRAPWTPCSGDDWRQVADVAAAAVVARACGRCPLVTLGARGGARFPWSGFARGYVRAIEDPGALPPGIAWLEARPPFEPDDEVALLERLEVDVLVSRNAGGKATAAKLDAARRLRLPVVMIERPLPPAGPLVGDVAAALVWLDQVLASRQT